MVSEAVQMNGNGEAESVVRRKSEQICCQGFSGRHDGTSSGSCCDDDSGEAKASSRDIKENLNSNVPSDTVFKQGRQQREMTFQDMYNDQDAFYDDGEDDDSDWEPLQKPVQIIKWFCTNCTMSNLDGTEQCDICGEHKKSGILRHGFLASPHSQDAGLPDVESEIMQRFKGGYLGIDVFDMFVILGNVSDGAMLLRRPVSCF